LITARGMGTNDKRLTRVELKNICIAKKLKNFTSWNLFLPLSEKQRFFVRMKFKVPEISLAKIVAANILSAVLCSKRTANKVKSSISTAEQESEVVKNKIGDLRSLAESCTGR